MESKKQEKDHQLLLWLTASILFHMLLLLIFFIIHIEQAFKYHYFKPKKQDNNDVITIQPIPQATQQPDQIPQKVDPSLTYTLIPGRKAVLDDQKQTQDNKLTKKEETKEDNTIHPDKDQAKNSKPQEIEKKPQLTQNDLSKIIETLSTKGSTIQTEYAPVKDHSVLKEITKSKNNPQESKTLTKNESYTDGIKEEPTIKKKKITLQDLKLGFSNFMQEGNNDILIQQGNTDQAPDPKSLKMITYSQQIARAMKEGITTHPNYHQAMYSMKKRSKAVIGITLARNGKLLDFRMIHSSDNSLLDDVIKQGLQSISLYPSVPSYIPQEPLDMTWTLLF